MAWLIFTIQITLQENEDDANGVANPGRTAELIRVRPSLAFVYKCQMTS